MTLGAGTLGGAIGYEEGKEHGVNPFGSALAGAAAGAAMESVAWRTVSAVTKDKIAQLISTGVLAQTRTR